MPIGTTLMNLRRERGKTLTDMESATKIMGRMLSALENERWEELPANVYVKGYIQNYASALGIDPRPLLDEYARDIATQSEHAPLRRIPEKTVVPHRLELHEIPRQAWIAIAVAVVVIALAVWAVTAVLGRDDTPPPIPPETTTTADVAPVTQTALEPEDLPQGAFALRIDVADGQSSWLQVKIDGLVAYEGTLPSGETKKWTVADTAVVRVGKPSAVAITRDGSPVTVPAADGIAEVTLVADDE